MKEEKMEVTKVPSIIDLDKVLSGHLDGRKLAMSSCSYLTQPGENYGSLMLNVVVTVRISYKHEEELHLVAKLPPITNELFWTLFQPQRTCVTENAVYKYLAPAMRKIQVNFCIGKEKIFDPFAAYYGSRLSLEETIDSDDKNIQVDKNAILLLENLLKANYESGNRFKMYNLVETEFIVRALAKFHALGVALRLKDRERFEKDLKPYFRRFDLNKNANDDVKKQFRNDLMEQLTSALPSHQHAECIEDILELLDEFYRQSSGPEAEDDLYTTIVHCDLWINNILLKYDQQRRLEDVKFVDFQISQYENAVHDLIFFLFSSCDAKVLDLHFDELLHCYYTTFVGCLREVGVDYKQKGYSYVSLIRDVYYYGPVQIAHALFMTRIILADPDTMPGDFQDMDMSVLQKNTKKTLVVERSADIVNLALKYRLLKRHSNKLP